ncbi:DUF2911 domain-containing protein [Emticicia sp. TH156]|uniref:DUF2911 domain-containing protein n=1 Tax=Emticicia sp. TH156 TaxID=2067454 RepID=UPI000C793752|nr:DUF2911 domain-containing protein [Emticicia sp. TH156]PLK43425.1 hypothetical protein C0V77_16090 [Emticicia sp. TH156]
MQKNTKTGVLAAVFFAFLFLTFAASAQDDKAKRPSPPVMASGIINGNSITINYGQPSVKGREIWGKLVPYGEVWRAGANEATTIAFAKDVTIEGKTLPAGKYGFFAIPGANEWTIIFNKVPNQWGAFKYDAAQDALRVTVKPKQAKAFSEKLWYAVNKHSVTLTWANTEVAFGVK